MLDWRGKARVLIPTTTGPVEVLRLTEEDAAIDRSVACVDGTTETADIDRAYHAFVTSPTGIIERLYGHRCYRLDVSGRIDAGSSWQLGVLVAHALHAAGRLAREGEPADFVILATGAVRAVDLTVREVTYVSKKIELGLDALKVERGSGTLLVVVPAANLSDVNNDLRSRMLAAGITITGVDQLDDLAAQLGLRLHAREATLTSSQTNSASQINRMAWGSSRLVMLAALFTVGALATYLAISPLKPDSPISDLSIALSKEFDGIWESRGYGGEACVIKSLITWHTIVEGGLIKQSRPEKGFIRATGEFRYTLPSRADPERTNEFTGKVTGNTGKGEYRTIGGNCAGTFIMTRVKR